jgi:uncharacterized protein (DUF1501 family)
LSVSEIRVTMIPTAPNRTSMLKGLLKDHLRLEDDVLAAQVFPGSAAVKPIGGLVG